MQKNINRPKFQRVQINRILENESRVRSAEIKDKLNQIRENEGNYPETERRLAQWILETRKGGVPVETCMVADEGKDILHKFYLLSFPAPSEFSDYRGKCVFKGK